MAKSFNISPTLKKNTKVEPTLAKKTTFKKTLKDVEEVEEKVEQIHKETIKKETVAKKAVSRVGEEPVKKSTRKNTKAKTTKTTARKGTTIVTADSKRLTVVMPKETHRRLKIKSINEEITLNELIVNLIEKELG
jgi:predicted HicB family RNase H-like nuclease